MLRRHNNLHLQQQQQQTLLYSSRRRKHRFHLRLLRQYLFYLNKITRRKKTEKNAKKTFF